MPVNRLKSEMPDNGWAVILAGGDGTRLRPLTQLIEGDKRPKQFCRILDGKTLLNQTRERVSLAVPPQQTLIVVTKTHEDFYPLLLRGVPPPRVLIQPKNRGAAPAILYSLLRIATAAPTASVAFFPSDYYISNDRKFMSHVASAFRAVDSHPQFIPLLGIRPDAPELNYGWIEPAELMFASGVHNLYAVHRFWEKPPLAQARRLLVAGSLWNSFVTVGRVNAFLKMIRRAVPSLYRCFFAMRRSSNKANEEPEIQPLYAKLPSTNFSQQVLASRPGDLPVLPVANVRWSNWGEPQRVLSDLREIGKRAALRG